MGARTTGSDLFFQTQAPPVGPSRGLISRSMVSMRQIGNCTMVGQASRVCHKRGWGQYL